MKSIAEQQLCCSIRRRRRQRRQRSWNHFRLFLNLSITPGVAKQIMHKPRNQSGQNYIVFVPHASSEWYLRCVSKVLFLPFRMSRDDFIILLKSQLRKK
jgi:hypothetical protein